MEPQTQTTTEHVKRRAEVLRDKVQIRLAVNEAGPAISAVLKENGIDLQADWSKVFPNWLIATVDDVVVGCCQVIPSNPVGYVEFLFVRPSAPFKIRAIAIRKLIAQSMSTLHLAGCQYVGGVVGQTNFKFADVLERLKFTKVYSADVYARRIA